MKIHEHQGKELLRQFGVPVPRGIPAFSVEEAVKAAETLGGPVWVVKAQIHAGGRGKGGGVKVAKSLDDVRRLAGEILGMQLVTHQTGPAGQKVRRLYIEDGADIKQEYYVSAVTDRATQTVAFIASSEGGMDIEAVAHDTPEKIVTVFADGQLGLTVEQATDLANKIGIPAGSTAQAVDIFQKLYRCYMDTDAALVEINPLNCDSKGNLMALDAKFNFDSNALFRHPEIVAYRDLDEEDPAEVEASKFDLAYIQLDGNIGCLVNGAGLAMATMDTIKLYGGEPANFLDVGGGATAEKVTEAFKIMLKNQNVKGILVNIFGGIMKCDTIADGVIQACKAVNLNVPLVVRMKGTNEDLGKKMLAESGLPIITANTMAEAAERVIAAVNGKATVAPAALAAGAAGVAAVGAAVASVANKATAATASVASAATAVTGNVSAAASTAVGAGVAAATGAATAAASSVSAGTAATVGAAGAGAAAVANVAKKGGIPSWAWLIAAAIAGFFLFRSCSPAKVEAPVAVPAAPVAAPAVTASAAVNAALPVAATCGTKTLAADVEFITGKAEVAANSVTVLETMAKDMATCAALKVEVAGHTDNVGDAAMNLSLSQARADAVVAVLVKGGVAADRLKGKGYGDTKPVADNATAEGKQKNRRVEFVAQ